VTAQIFQKLILVELWYIESLIPVIVKFVLDDYLADGKVDEVEGLVDELTKGSLACSWGSRNYDVRRFASHVLFRNHC
jgi:hypothetical protein